MSSRLETIFQKTAKSESGSCPLPEPGRGAPVIEHPAHMRIKEQPEQFRYDKPYQKAEKEGFLARLKALLAAGEILDHISVCLSAI